MRKLTRKEARKKAEGSTESLSRLLSPRDVVDGADGWDDIPDERMKSELEEVSSVFITEGQTPYKSLVRDLAISLWMEDLPRVNMDHLKTDVRRTVVLSHGYWPYDMSYSDMWEMLQSVDYHQIPTSLWVDAVNEVQAGIIDGLDPR